MKHDDLMNRLRKGALVLPVAALPVLASSASAQDVRSGQDEYKVVINHEEQYSIWSAEQRMSRPWRETGETCTLKGCTAYIEEVWTDMRPLSLRKQMEEAGLERDEMKYKVVINHEEQYSIWSGEQDVRGTWRETGQTCAFDDCMDYIEEVWTDMRPLSLRKQLGEEK